MINEFKDVDKLSSQNFEVFVKTLLEASGWSDAIITQVGKEFRHGDGGVDIFAYKSGRKFAIEVKQRNLQTNVDIKSLNQLVTGAKLAKVNNMILVTNSYYTSEVRVRALRLGVELIDRDELQNLWIKKHSEIGRDIKPRNYQESVIKQSLSKYKDGKRKILIEMATGLGKTYTVALLIKELIKQENRRPKVLFIAHQVEILLQSVTAFKNVLGIGSYSFSACFSGSNPESTDFVFASFDTLYGQLDNLKSEFFDYIIIDEAHHTPAKTYSEVVTHFNPQLLIGLTATPFRSDEKNVFDFFGGSDCHIGKYDLVWALKHRKLAFPKYLVQLDDLDQKKIEQLEAGLSINDLDKRLFLHKKDEEIVRIVEQTVEKRKIPNVKGIVFCRSISHLNHILGFFKLGSATSVHSKMRESERRENIRNFREGDFKFILVCDLFNEGVDIPETNLLVFIRYTGSRTIWMQQLGRGLRKTPNKEYVHVLDFVGSLERLDEVKRLSNAVAKRKIEFENLDDTDEVNDKFNIIHDNSLMVEYSESAAKVLELIESLKYRLHSRENLLEKIRVYKYENGTNPNIDCIESALNDVTKDQISTHFDSYLGYLTAAFGDNICIDEMKSRVSDYVSEHFKTYNIIPSNNAITLKFSVENLLEFTQSEVASFNIETPEDLNLKKVIPKTASINEEINIIKQLSDCKKTILLEHKNTITSRSDLKKLNEDQLQLIKTEFRSVSIFLKELKGHSYD